MTLAAPRALWAANRSDVIVIGAGLSGLQAAMILEESGAAVTVLEASNRIGGRIFTQDDVPGRPEAGGSEVGAMYARVQTMIERLNLKLHPAERASQTYSYRIDGTNIAASDWVRSAANPLRGTEHDLLPTQLTTHYMQRRNPLEDLESWLGADAAKFDISYERYLHDLGTSPEAIRLMQVESLADSLSDVSALWELRRQKLRQFSSGAAVGLHYLEGGMSRLPEAMSAALASDVRTGQQVVSIDSTAHGVEVRCRNGQVFQARYVICSLPLTVLRSIKITPGLPKLQQEAIQKIPYGNATTLFYAIKEPYWEADGLPPAIWSNNPYLRAFKMNSDDRSLSYLWVFLSGAGNKAIRAASIDDASARVGSMLAEIRPSTVGRIEFMRAFSWSQNPYSLGTFAHRAPGQISRFGNVAANQAGRVHFAGEHTAVLMSGLEGAMESGERAAVEVLERL
ncbi:flavin monoamine oxidase family protein [Govanella unica]|uniref:FAD-dependent oxidoreductase n=1 Tax=Govanella unica TaxID=2975056 RepID=A0A9X3TWQ4_9PROT|nr:FAD-dependent oxidoreductase [Govania unica]MDA5192832.1 FAD-dependent oxidoreductase [Govania unica]